MTPKNKTTKTQTKGHLTGWITAMAMVDCFSLSVDAVDTGSVFHLQCLNTGNNYSPYTVKYK
jgi:hypothetical protein